MMRSFLFAAFAAVLAMTGPASAQDAKQDFKLVNKTGYELKALYVSPSKADDWQEDILGQDTLADGGAVNVHFNPKANICTWDLKVVYSDDDSSAVWTKIDLCTIEKITIHYNRKSDETTGTFD
jgi:hypothetical protein